MITKLRWLSSFLLLCSLSGAQNFKGVYKIDELLQKLNNKDTVYVVNFWATWCKPCIQELPAFDSLYLETKQKQAPVKVLLVCIDFKEELEVKVKPFLLQRSVQAECILLDEVNGNDFINRISENWSGAIPATYFKKGKQELLVEKKMHLAELNARIKSLQNKE